MSTETTSPPIERFMTLSPHTIGKTQTLAAARQRMREHRIRHLPVLDAGRLVGVLSERDLDLVEGLEGIDPEIVRVEDAMTPEPYVVSPDTSVVDVAKEMAARKYGAAIVARRKEDREEVVGVFTTVDGLWALVDLLEPRV